MKKGVFILPVELVYENVHQVLTTMNILEIFETEFLKMVKNVEPQPTN